MIVTLVSLHSNKHTHTLPQYLLTVKKKKKKKKKKVALKRNLIRLGVGVSVLKSHRLPFSKKNKQKKRRNTSTALFAKTLKNENYTSCWYAQTIQH